MLYPNMWHNKQFLSGHHAIFLPWSLGQMHEFLEFASISIIFPWGLLMVIPDTSVCPPARLALLEMCEIFLKGHKIQNNSEQPVWHEILWWNAYILCFWCISLENSKGCFSGPFWQRKIKLDSYSTDKPFYNTVLYSKDLDIRYFKKSILRFLYPSKYRKMAI